MATALCVWTEHCNANDLYTVCVLHVRCVLQV